MADLPNADALSLAPLDGSATVDCDAAPLALLGVGNLGASVPAHSGLHGAHIEDVDEAQLLADTEELLRSLDPVVFTESPAAPKSEIAAKYSRYSSPCATSQSAANHEVSIYKHERVVKPGKQRNPSRERLQSELSHLRKQVLVLENQLQNINERQISASDDAKIEMEVVVPMWERIAKRQLVACEQAVGDNKRLKNMIKIQKELVVNMEESLYNWQHLGAPQLALLGSSASTTTPHKNVHLEPGDDLLFEMLVSELDATYMKIDEAFQEAFQEMGHDRVTTEPYTRVTPKTHVSSDGTIRSFFEIVEVELFPFDFELTNRVARFCCEKQSESPDCVTYHRDWGFEDIVTEKHRVKRDFDGSEIYFHMLLAYKEYEFEDQIVSVWRGIFKSDAHFPDAYVQEIGWFISANLAAQSCGSAASPVGSITKSCVHFEPKLFGTPGSVIKAEADTMTTLVLNSYQDDMQEINAMIEKMLIQETLRQKAS